MKKNCFVIILNWNKLSDTLECLDSLRQVKCKTANISVIVVDNGSTLDDSRKVLKDLKHITLLQNKDNLGYVGGNNVGISYALKHGADCVMLLNNDIVATPNFLDPLVKALYSKKDIGIVGPITLFYDNKKIIADAGGLMRSKRYFGVSRASNELFTKKYTDIKEVDFIIGAAQLIKKEVFKKIGLLKNKYFIYYEDADFCFQARRTGYKSLIVPVSKLYHKVSATVKVNSPMHQYYTTRNHLLFLERNVPKKLWFRELIRLPKTTYEFLLDNNSVKRKYSLLGIRDYLLRRFGKRTYW